MLIHGGDRQNRAGCVENRRLRRFGTTAWIVVFAIAAASCASTPGVPTASVKSDAGAGSPRTSVVATSVATTTTRATATTKATTTIRATTTTAYVRQPTMELFCPEDFSYAYGTTATVTFGYSFNLGSAADAEFTIYYGDGKTWYSPDAANAERNAFWHDYETSGSFTPYIEMRTSSGLTAAASCSFTYSWLAPPPASSGGGSFGNSGFDPESCTYQGIPLYGRVKVVDFLADFDVRVVDFLPDLRVQIVDYLPISCGKWEFVDFLWDFTVRFVDYLGDIDIQFVDYLPGT